MKQEKPKQETLEEVAEKESEYLADWEDKDMYKKGFIDCAKWQQQQNKNLYSEEEVYNLLIELSLIINNIDIESFSIEKWFNQNKKK